MQIQSPTRQKSRLSRSVHNYALINALFAAILRNEAGGVFFHAPSIPSAFPLHRRLIDSICSKLEMPLGRSLRPPPRVLINEGAWRLWALETILRSGFSENFSLSPFSLGQSRSHNEREVRAQHNRLARKLRSFFFARSWTQPREVGKKLHRKRRAI